MQDGSYIPTSQRLFPQQFDHLNNSQVSGAIFSRSLLEELSESTQHTLPQNPKREFSAEELAEGNLAATKIQKVWRGYLGRLYAANKARALLSGRLIEIGKPFVENPESIRELPRASSGETPVYFPRGLPIILKASGKDKGAKRLQQMELARHKCEDNHYRHLVIPSAKICGEFLIESRLPIKEHDYKLQIGLYIENRDKFTRAAKEFVGFLCQSDLDDLTGGFNVYSCLTNGAVPRFDNAVLYLENGEGRVGLVDLEHYYDEKSAYILAKCREAVLFFPLHIEEIIATAKQFDPSIEKSRAFLETNAQGIIKLHKALYWDHLNFLQQQGISINNPLHLNPLSKERRQEICGSILLKYADPRVQIIYKMELMTMFQQSPDALSAAIDITIQMLSKFISRNLNEAPPSTNLELLHARTLAFSEEDEIFEEAGAEILNILPVIYASQAIEKTKNYYAKLLARDLIMALFQEFAQGGELQYFNSSFGGNHMPFIQC